MKCLFNYINFAKYQLSFSCPALMNSTVLSNIKYLCTLIKICSNYCWRILSVCFTNFWKNTLRSQIFFSILSTATSIIKLSMNRFRRWLLSVWYWIVDNERRREQVCQFSKIQEKEWIFRLAHRILLPMTKWMKKATASDELFASERWTFAKLNAFTKLK